MSEDSPKLHILIVNDDGPPSLESSPYVHPLVAVSKDRGHEVSVCLPDQQRSWIGKAQFKDKTISPQAYTPSPDPYSGGKDSSTHPDAPGDKDWVLIEGTPATCTQLGLFHLFNDKKDEIDVVLSGPNYGRNVTALFSLSSGTLGGAMEAATFGRKAIALSFAFWGRNHDPKLIQEACEHSLEIVEHLVSNWGQGVDIYSVNVPIVEGVKDRGIIVAPILPNQWTSGSCFEEIEGQADENPDKKEQGIRAGGLEDGTKLKTTGSGRSFRWNPKFQDVQDSIERSKKTDEVTDGSVIVKKQTSITPLKANFMHVEGTSFGELKL